MSAPLPSSSELLELFRTAADATLRGRTRADGTPVRLKWTPTSMPGVLRAACVRLAQRALWVVDSRFRASFLDTAEGADLDAWAASEAPGFPRNPASAAVTRVVLLRSDATEAGTIFAGSRFSTTATPSAPAVTFTSTEDVSVPSGQTLVTVTVECDATGPAGNVIASAITTVMSPLFNDFTVSLSEEAAGGDVAERDEVYRDRLRQRDARYRRGTVEAVRLGALSVPGVSRVDVRSAQQDTSIPAGELHVIVADASGIGSQPLADRVALALESWAACGIIVTVYPAEVIDILDPVAALPMGTTALRLDITLRRGRNDLVALERDVRAALRRLFESMPPATPLHLTQLTATVHAAATGVVRDVHVIALPSGSETFADWPGAPDVTTAQRWGASDDMWRFSWSVE